MFGVASPAGRDDRHSEFTRASPRAREAVSIFRTPLLRAVYRTDRMTRARSLPSNVSLIAERVPLTASGVTRITRRHGRTIPAIEPNAVESVLGFFRITSCRREDMKTLVGLA